jgi:hypothetical protein
MELSTSVAGPEAPVRAVATPAPAAAIDRQPKGEGRAIASLVLTILSLLTVPVPVPAFALFALLGLMLAADSWEDIERDPLRRGRNLAMATFWIIGVCFALALLAGLILMIVG